MDDINLDDLDALDVSDEEIIPVEIVYEVDNSCGGSCSI